MKKLFLLFVFLKGMNVVAQQIVVANNKMNIVYYGVNNQLSVAIAGYPCQSVILTVNSGKIKKKGCSEFDYTPNFIGDVELKVWVKTKVGKKLVDKR